MARFFQYQNKTEPVTVPAVVSTVVAVAISATEVFFPRSIIYQAKAEPVVVQETITVDKWHRPLSEPVVKSRRFPTGEQQSLAFQFPYPTAPIGAVSTRLEGPPSSVRLLQYQSVAFPVPVVENITVDKWFEPLSEPKRVKVRNITAGQFSAPFVSVVGAVAPTTQGSPIQFRQSLIYQNEVSTPFVQVTATITTARSSPVSFKRRLIYQSAAYTPFVSETVTLDKWFEPLSEPRRRKASEARQPLAQTPFVEPTIVSKWFAPLSEPTRRKVSVARQPTAQAPFTVETVTLDKWFESFSEPRRRKVSEARQPLAQVPFVEPTIVSKWFEPLSEPLRAKQGLGARYQQDLAWSTFTPTAVAVTFFPMVQGDTGLTFEKTVIYQVEAGAQAEDVYESKWHQSWSEPVRLRRFPTAEQRAYFAPEATLPRAEATIAAAQMPSVSFPRSIIYQSVAWTPQPIAVEVITEDKWHQPWSEPVRRKGLRTDQQQVLAWSTFTPTVVTAIALTTSSSPVFFRHGLIYQAQAWTPQPIIPAVVTSTRSSPVSFKRRIIYQSVAAPVFTPTPAVITAVSPTTASSPVFFKHWLIYQAEAWTPQTITPPPFTFLSNPDEIVTFGRTTIYDPLASVLEPIIPDKWYEPFSEPVRIRRPNVDIKQAQVLFIPPVTAFATTITQSSQVSFPSRLIYQALTQPVQPPPVIVIFPQTTAPAIVQFRRLFIYQPTAMPPVLPPSDVTIVIDATETNNDTAAFYAVVYNRPVRCYISIKEIPRGDDAFISIEET